MSLGWQHMAFERPPGKGSNALKGIDMRVDGVRELI